jgi:hypothetical protein
MPPVARRRKMKKSDVRDVSSILNMTLLVIKCTCADLNLLVAAGRRLCYEDQLSYAIARIHELEDELGEARDTIRQLVEGNQAEWEWDT